MEIKLRTLTPIWTGGIDQTCDRLHETGLIGSLRWWYEALVRGLGGYDCDPTKHGCPNKAGEVCAACCLFGTTGWGRKFRLRVYGKQRASPEFGELKVNPEQKRGSRLGAGVLSDELTVTVLPMRPTDQHELNVLAFLVYFVARWAALGARTQMGYGVVDLDTIAPAGNAISAREIADSLTLIERAARKHPAPGPMSERLPDIRDFFFARLRLPPGVREATLKWLGEPRYVAAREQGFVPSAPGVRYEMRSWLRDPAFVPGVRRLDDLRHDLMGTTQKSSALDAPRGSRLFVSHLYQTGDGWEFRVWGWVPNLSAYNVRRDTLLQAIRQRLEEAQFGRAVFGLTQPLQLEWHSFDRQGTQSLGDYLRSLVRQIERRSK
ncbi:MAG: type III-B CRISPR module RAMP protein Cmr1 [Syntrophaceae bacterium]|nr:type III-B CRISPR module RAMP protein Cmr1 [Syntrophaceae bacterium]